ncbi:MAG: VOC family protein [Christensenellales bacterium]|jgi:lactoylglutathione lyase
MIFKLEHVNLNVTDLNRSIAFYKEALGLSEKRRVTPEHGKFELVFMGGESEFMVELTWLKDKEGKYDLGDNETHLAFRTYDYEAAHKKHSDMGCICYENEAMGLYFIEDPDGYWIEILPPRAG